MNIFPQFLISAFLLIPIMASSQFTVDKLSKEEFDMVSKKKTIFIAGSLTGEEREIISSQIKQYWDLTEIEVVSYEDYLAFEGDRDQYNYLGLGGRRIIKDLYDCTFIELQFWSYKQRKNKKKKPVRLEIAKWPIFVTPEVFHTTMELSGEDKIREVLLYLNTEAEFYNWEPGFILSNIGIMCKLVQKRKKVESSDEVLDSDKLKSLKKECLYVPDYLFVKFNMWKIKESDKELNPNTIFKKYGYKYKVLPANELSDLILNSDEKIYFLQGTKNCNKLILNVVESKTNEVIYTDSPKRFRYNISSGEIKRLARKIK